MAPVTLCSLFLKANMPKNTHAGSDQKHKYPRTLWVTSQALKSTLRMIQLFYTLFTFSKWPQWPCASFCRSRQTNIAHEAGFSSSPRNVIAGLNFEIEAGDKMRFPPHGSFEREQRVWSTTRIYPVAFQAQLLLFYFSTDQQTKSDYLLFQVQ